MPPEVIFVVLNWNGAADTLACLRSLTHAGIPPAGILAVDNGSTDDSMRVLAARDIHIELIGTGHNLGYAGGNNVGIRRALATNADAICILNNDVTVEPGFLEPMLAALYGQPDIGVVTPLVAESADGDARVWALGSVVDRRTAVVSRQHAGEPVTAWRQREPFEVEIASGAAMLVKAEVFERVGLLDESFFLYYEETDWCLKARQAGYCILAVPSSVVWHKVSATLGTTSPIIDYYMLRNHLRLIGRHWSGMRRLYLLVRTTARNLATVAAYTAKSHGGRRIPNRNARLLALRDTLLGRSGAMGADVHAACKVENR